ncbi:TetR family transcriptional regulator [Cryobacterium sp. TMT1-21]|uniref:TetR family transcriptional regulator n=1 Tax=Cryobacterium shii TaxID=1259235 RepID=A0AAQ2C8T1_9MICO|nr:MULTISPECIES: TetR/AcrR family transcriptional regulator C-terminal domain-containing protein [Cryobacterium]TFC52555.1 TetR family transcriptional regulator [Cryobacterium shii]TFC81506.1 TetR family transcriptional regulator [Cryobacterium sp. TmT2-59]TFD13952.1 TetR family transcriptional regulator [Cryobacterium sp. TMT4-10]TFD13989.1 TetR family transcriptional regulator [Cryobacterium sp. TMT1-21]TFD18280.1 TetR family transcriptional regulator [Cryobacterium sp. TMT2-23]
MSLSKRQIVIAALELAEKQGAERLTMRSLAANLDRRPSSLYNHISGRDDLIEGMRALVVEEIDTSVFAVKGWDDAVIVWAESYLSAFAARPSCIRLLATTPITDPSTLRMYDIVVSALVRGGWADGDAVAVMRTIEALVLGSALDAIAPSSLLSLDAVPLELEALRRSLEPGHRDRAGARAAFVLGMEALVEGLRVRLAAERSSSGPPGQT